jgi:UDP-glucose 4-epimerase
VSRRRVVISGATGFVGAHLARRMLERGHEVHALVRETHRTWRLAEVGGLHVHVADVVDGPAMATVLAGIRPHWVLHLAAYGGYESQADVARCVRTNLEGSINLIEAAAKTGAERFVNAGSSSEYGFKDHAPAETEMLEPNSVYAVTKAAATAYARYAGRSAKLHATTLRLYSVFGPYEEPTRLIPTVILHGLDGGFPPFASPDIARDFVHVDDVTAAFEAALGADIPSGEIYNIGTGIETSLRTVAQTARSVFGIAAEPQWQTMADRRWDTKRWIADNARARAELGWKPAVAFEDGFRSFAEWLADPQRRSFYRSSRELSA